MANDPVRSLSLEAVFTFPNTRKGDSLTNPTNELAIKKLLLDDISTTILSLPFLYDKVIRL